MKQLYHPAVQVASLTSAYFVAIKPKYYGYLKNNTYSFDGTYWVTQNVTTGVYFKQYGILWVGTQWIIVGTYNIGGGGTTSHDNAQIAVAADGNTWSSVTVVGYEDWRMHGIVYDNESIPAGDKRYIIWGDTGIYYSTPTHTNQHWSFISVCTSLTGTWTKIDTNLIFQGTNRGLINEELPIGKVIVYRDSGGVKYFAVGMNTTGKNYAISSNLGLSWVGYTGPSGTDLYDAAWDGNATNPIIIAVGRGTNKISKYESGSWTSSNLSGIDLGKSDNTIFSIAYSPKAYNGIKWVAGGRNRNSTSTQWGSTILTSPDGINWTGRPAYFTYVNQVSWNGKIFIISGGWGQTPPPPQTIETKYSYDGITLYDFPVATQSTEYPRYMGCRAPIIPKDTTIPSNPTNLVAAGQEGQIYVSWTPSIDQYFYVRKYEIWRSLDNVNYTHIDDQEILFVSGNNNLFSEYADVTVTPTVVYYYKVKAVDSVGNTSGFSNSDWAQGM